MAATPRNIANRFFLVISMLLIASVCCAQAHGGQHGLPKGSLFGVHVITVDLKPGATIEQFRDFFVGTVLPEYEKQWVGLHGYLVRSVRGELKNRFAIVWLFESEAARNRYFTPDDKPNALEKAALEAVKPIEEALKRYGTYTIKYADDWVVQ